MNKKTGIFVIAIAGVVALGSMLGVGCSTTNNNGGSGAGTSALGQSCADTADCQSGLVCLTNTCFADPNQTNDASAGADGATADGAATGPHLAGLGEACQTSRDCTSGYDCVASVNGSACDIVTYGLTSSDKTCTGQCKTATDCCELPPNLNLELFVQTDGGGETVVFANRCEDLLFALNGDATVCQTADSGTTDSVTRQACFYYQTFCSCAANTWACTDSQCVYSAPCHATVSDTIDGCPSSNRLGFVGAGTCNLVTNSCSRASCATDTDCYGKPAADNTSQTCRGGDAGAANCTCYKSSGCYFKCSKDIDCVSGSKCDTTTNVCVAQTCTTNTQCAMQLNNARAACSAGACVLPCSTDHDCSPSGDLPGPGFDQRICSAGFCKTLGCSTDDDCTSGSVHTFCVTPAAASGVTSAITN